MTLAGELVPAHHARLDAGDPAVVEVQIGAADGARRDLAMASGGFDDLGSGTSSDAQVAGPVGADGVHGRLSRGGGRSRALIAQLGLVRA